MNYLGTVPSTTPSSVAVVISDSVVGFVVVFFLVFVVGSVKKGHTHMYV